VIIACRGIRLALDCGPAALPREWIEQCLRRFATHDRVCDGIGMLLLSIGRAAVERLEVNPTALLNDVRSFVRGRVEVRRARKCDVAAVRVGACAELATRGGCRSADVRADAGDVVRTKRGLDLIVERQPLARPFGALCCRRLRSLGKRDGLDREHQDLAAELVDRRRGRFPASQHRHRSSAEHVRPSPRLDAT